MIATAWRKTGVYLLLLGPTLGLAGGGLLGKQSQDSGAQQDVDPVAAAARRAREQKKDSPKPKKVYTDDDLGSGGARPAAAPTSGSGSKAPSDTEAKEAATTQGEPDAAPGGKGASADKNDEATWRKKFREAREKLADAEKELDILQREQQKAQVQYYSDPQKAMNEQYNRKDIADKDTRIAAKKQEVEQLKQHLSDMEDELRRAGGDLGWSRE